jgi:DNA-binding CsgD family transcriptional regulator
MTGAVSQRPTRRQLEVLRAYIAAGSIAAAAHELDIAESTARQHLSSLYRRTGCASVAQAAYWLGASQRRSQPAIAKPTAASASPPGSAVFGSVAGGDRHRP